MDMDMLGSDFVENLFEVMLWMMNAPSKFDRETKPQATPEAKPQAATAKPTPNSSSSLLGDRAVSWWAKLRKVRLRSSVID